MDEADEIDIWDCEDVHNVDDDGGLLYMKFESEDWALLNLRYELWLLAHAFKKDVDDADRPGIHESNIGFYYKKYFKRELNTQAYGAQDFTELVKLCKHVVHLEKPKSGPGPLLLPDLSEGSELPMFIKLTEESRRDRKRRIDTGDESVKLKFNLAHLPTEGGKGGYDRGGKGKRSYGDRDGYGGNQRNKGQRRDYGGGGGYGGGYGGGGGGNFKGGGKNYGKDKGFGDKGNGKDDMGGFGGKAQPGNFMQQQQQDTQQQWGQKRSFQMADGNAGGYDNSKRAKGGGYGGGGYGGGGQMDAGGYGGAQGGGGGYG